MSSDINVQTFSGKVNINNNLLVGSSHLFVDTVNNRVGITTADPDAGLHVNSNAYVHTDFRVGTSIVMNDTTGQITAGSFVGDGSGLDGINSDSGSWVNGTDVVYLSTIGDKVGIGTTSPQQKLDLGDLGGGSIRLGRDHDDDNTSTNRIGRTGVGNDVWYSSVNFIDEDTNDDAISFVTHESGVGQFERMRISGNGNVGIGTTDPLRKFHVFSGVGDTSANWISGVFGGSGDYPRVVMGSLSTYACVGSHNSALNAWSDLYLNNPTNPVVVKTTGKVGIGTTDPTYNLDVSGNLRVTTGILDTSWCSGSWLQTCTESPTVTVYSNNGGGPMSTPGHGGTGMGGNRGLFTAKKAGNYLISCCAVHMGRGSQTSSGTNLLVVFDAVGTHWDLNNVINTYDEIIDLRVAPTAEEAYTFACQVYMNVGHYFSFRVHSSGYTDDSAKLLCSAALVR